MSKWRIVLIALLLAAGATYSTWALRDGTGDSAVRLWKGPAALVFDRVREIKVGQPQSYGGLTVFPLIGRTIGGLEYVTLDEAMKQGSLVVSEKDSGDVNEIVVRNRSARRVFIMDGEELVGAKQNRVANSSVMIAPKQLVHLPVSCVEHGRWASVSPQFKAGETQLFATARQANVAAVTHNYDVQPSAGAQSDQAMIWEKVAEKRVVLSVGARTGPMHEAYDKYGKDIGDYIGHFELVHDQVGAVFAINGEIIGADMFDQERTLRSLFRKLVKSYALDAIEKGDVRTTGRIPSPSREDALRFLRRVLEEGVSIRDYASPGEGRDVRITSPRINGASLVDADRPVHISLFAPEKETPLPAAGIRPSSERRQMR